MKALYLHLGRNNTNWKCLLVIDTRNSWRQKLQWSSVPHSEDKKIYTFQQHKP